MIHLLGMPQWGEYLLKGILIFIMLSCAAVAVGRAGRNTFWALLMIVPVVQIIAIWVFAFTKWPAEKQTKEK